MISNWKWSPLTHTCLLLGELVLVPSLGALLAQLLV